MLLHKGQLGCSSNGIKCSQNSIKTLLPKLSDYICDATSHNNNCVTTKIEINHQIIPIIEQSHQNCK